MSEERDAAHAALVDEVIPLVLKAHQYADQRCGNLRRIYEGLPGGPHYGVWHHVICSYLEGNTPSASVVAEDDAVHHLWVGVPPKGNQLFVVRKGRYEIRFNHTGPDGFPSPNRSRQADAFYDCQGLLFPLKEPQTRLVAGFYLPEDLESEDPPFVSLRRITKQGGAFKEEWHLPLGFAAEGAPVWPSPSEIQALPAAALEDLVAYRPGAAVRRGAGGAADA